MIGNWIADVVYAVEVKSSKQGDIESSILAGVKVLTERFPIYGSSKII